MKKLIYSIGTMFIISCSPSQEEILITDYEQTVGNTTTNLNMKFVKIEFVKDVRSRDSLEFYTQYFDQVKNKKIEEFEFDIELLEVDLNQKKRVIKELELVGEKRGQKIYQDKIDKIEKDIIRYNEWIGLLNGNCKGTFLEETYIKKTKLESNLDSVLSREYNVIYTINNPMLNNVEQSINKTYYFNPEITKILKVGNGDE